MKYIAIILFSLFFCSPAKGQHQLIVLKKGRVVKRFDVDDFIRYSTAKKKDFVRERIVELTDSVFITTNDTIAPYQIRLIDVGRNETPGITGRKVGMYALQAGVILPLGDWVNIRLIQDRHYEPDPGLSIASVALITTGALCLILDKPYRKTISYRLRIVDHTSPLYHRDRPIQRSNLIPGN